MLLIQESLAENAPLEIPVERFNAKIMRRLQMKLCNYYWIKIMIMARLGENMRVSSITDIILMKLYRVKQIER